MYSEYTTLSEVPVARHGLVKIDGLLATRNLRTAQHAAREATTHMLLLVSYRDITVLTDTAACDGH